MAMDKEQFLENFRDDYGYPNNPLSIDEIRSSEFKRLDDLVYLDHAGATLYSDSQIQAVFKDLTSSVYGNPHSQSDSSSSTADAIADARQQVLDYCNASSKEYSCIFTSGATAGLKLVGETFPWSGQSCFMYTMENHNSVLGIREYALSRGAAACAVDVEMSEGNDSSCKLIHHSIQRRKNEVFKEEEEVYNLFAFPSECNFTGLRFNLDLVKMVKDYSRKMLGNTPQFKGNWLVLVDAAKGCSTQPPDLSMYPADFVVISFYKLFGYPTGLGALVVRNEASKLLTKTYFSGGTVATCIADTDFVKMRQGVEEMFEDGTISFLSIASIRHGFRILNPLTPSAICKHTLSLAAYTRKTLLSLKHNNGVNVCMLYGDEKFGHDFGPIVTFNLKRLDGSWVGYREVEKLASLSRIQMRTGCFCNPGACAKYLQLSYFDLVSNMDAGHVCWDDHDLVDGKPTGAIRVSFGYMSTFEDAKKWIEFVINSFVNTPSFISFPHALSKTQMTNKIFLKSIFVYPIKSCGGFSVDSWPLSKTGFLHDREWVLTSPTGDVLTQKRVPRIGLISTSVDLNEEILTVESRHCAEKLKINLRSDLFYATRDEVNVSGQRFEVWCYDNTINTWFSHAVGCRCILLRHVGRQSASNGNSIGLCRSGRTTLNFTNEAQFLLISEESVADLFSRLPADVRYSPEFMGFSPMRFRPNLIITGGVPYAEDRWKRLRIGRRYFMSIGGCNRCQMVNLNVQQGKVVSSSEPLATLASYRRVRGRINFGILLIYESDNYTEDDGNSWLHTGEEIYLYAD